MGTSNISRNNFNNVFENFNDYTVRKADLKNVLQYMRKLFKFIYLNSIIHAVCNICIFHNKVIVKYK